MIRLRKARQSVVLVLQDLAIHNSSSMVMIIPALVALLAAPIDYVPEPTKVEVEVSPKRFATITRWDWQIDDPKNVDETEFTRLSIAYDSKTLEWQGDEIPVVLRIKDESVYLVGFDREKCREIGDFRYRFNYFRSSGDAFLPIARSEFPKDLATQNMWLADKDTESAISRLDTSEMKFRLSPNAAIWLDLMAGELATGPVEKNVLDEFIRKYSPSRLTVLQRRPN